MNVQLKNGFFALFLIVQTVFLFSFLLSAKVYAGAPFANKDTPVNQRAWREMWNKESNKKVPRYDKAYQEGRKIFFGRGNYENYKYCVPKVGEDTLFAEDDTFSAEFVGMLEKVKLNRKTIAPYRGLTVVNFAKVLYDCDDPGTLVFNKIEKENAGLVIYYLHSHYSLQLEQELKGGGKLARIRDPHNDY